MAAWLQPQGARQGSPLTKSACLPCPLLCPPFYFALLQA